MTRNQGIPRIDSELMVGLALLNWTPQQLSNYSVAVGWPISLQAIQDALGMPVRRFELSATGDAYINLCETLATLGLGFSHGVFGVKREFNVRLSFANACPSPVDAINTLLENLGTPTITLAIDSPEILSGERSLMLLIETPYTTRLLYDAGPVEREVLQAIVSMLYAGWLPKVSVVTECISCSKTEGTEHVVEIVLNSPALSASNLSKDRALQLLSGEQHE